VYTSQPAACSFIFPWSHMVKRLVGWLVLVFLPLSHLAAQQSSTKKELTIESIFAEGSITGRGPETIKWSPDGTRVSFVQRDDSGDRGELWYVDVASGEKKVLVSEVKLATLAPPVAKIKDEREKERLTRYAVAAYLWAPDSRHLLFDSQGQLWMYSLDNGIGVQFTSSPDPSLDPKFAPDGGHVAYVRKHNLYVRPISGKKEKQLTAEKDENLLDGEVDWLYAEELSVRSNYFWSPDSSQIVFLQMDETQVPAYPITDWMPTHPKVDMEKQPDGFWTITTPPLVPGLHYYTLIIDGAEVVRGLHGDLQPLAVRVVFDRDNLVGMHVLGRDRIPDGLRDFHAGQVDVGHPRLARESGSDVFR